MYRRGVSGTFLTVMETITLYVYAHKQGDRLRHLITTSQTFNTSTLPHFDRLWQVATVTTRPERYYGFMKEHIAETRAGVMSVTMSDVLAWFGKDAVKNVEAA